MVGRPKVIVLDVVGLSLAHFARRERMPSISSLLGQGEMMAMKPIFPALTLPVQASLTTGDDPSSHGIVANGFYFAKNHQVAFWEQAACLVETERLWTRLARKDPPVTTAALFFQNTMYSDCGAVITPRPMHTHDGGLINWCYSKPVGLYEGICKIIGGEFPLHNYWGPFASIDSSSWIASAAVQVLERVKPDLTLVYLPHLDYCLQRCGPDHPAIYDELEAVDREAGKIIAAGKELFGDDALFVVLSEYAFSAVRDAVPLNLILRREGLLHVRQVKGVDYIDLELSPAFALVDHQVAHVYVKPGHERRVRSLLEKTEGIDMVMGKEEQKRYGVSHRRAGDFVVASCRDRWFSYYWWGDPATAPDFAGHVDIHRKPGYDPLELFIDRSTMKIPQDTSLIKGSHGYPPVAAEDKVPFIVSRSDLLKQEADFTTAAAGRFIESLFN